MRMQIDVTAGVEAAVAQAHADHPDLSPGARAVMESVVRAACADHLSDVEDYARHLGRCHPWPTWISERAKDGTVFPYEIGTIEHALCLVALGQGFEDADARGLLHGIFAHPRWLLRR